MSNKKFKLLYLSSDKHPARRVDVSVLFGEKLASRGHSIDFVLQSEGDCARTYEQEWMGCRVLVGKTNNGVGRLARVMKHIYSLLLDIGSIRKICSRKYDFVQIKDKYLSALFIIPACKLFGVKFVYWQSFPFPEESLIKAKSADANYPLFYWIRGIFFDFMLYRVIAPASAFIFVQSEQMKRDLVSRGVPAEKQLPVPMGVSIERFPQLDFDTKAENSTPKVLYLGTMARVRHMDFMIRAFAKVLEQVPQAMLYMVGSGDEPLDMEILDDEASRLGIREHVVFTGMLPMSEALQYVAIAWACVSPFYPTPVFNSTSPTKLVEYMAMGKPVVANDHPEQKLVIESSGAGICVPYDEQAFADAIVQLLRSPSDCQDMGHRGRVYVEKYRTYDHIADMVELQYLSLIDRSRVS